MQELPSGTPNTPPTGPAGMLARDPSDSTWPGWLGGFAIGIGSLMVMGACCGSIGVFLPGWAMRTAGMEVPPPPAATLVFMAIDGVVGIVLAAFLILGGMGTLRRRQSGAGKLRTYAFVRIALALPILLGALWMLPAYAEWGAKIAQASVDFKERQKPPIPVTQMERYAASATEPTTFQRVSVMFTALGGLVFPVIVLVVLGRAGTKQDIASFDP